MEQKKWSFLISHIFEIAEPIFYQLKPADISLHYFFKQKKYLGATDRRIISETIYEAIRTLPRIELQLKQQNLGQNLTVPVSLYAALSCKHKPDSIQNIISSLLNYPQHLWRKIDKAVEKEYEPTSEIEKIAYQTAFPTWFVQQLLQSYSVDEVVQMLTILNQNAKVHLRVNTYLATPDAVTDALQKEGITAQKGNLCPETLIVEHRKPIFTTQTYKKGWIELQDEGSQVVAWLVNPKPGKTVLDACAGGGGKTLHIATLMKGKGTVFAYEIDPQRFGNIKQRIRRSQLQNIRLLDTVQKFEAFKQAYTGKVDYVLIDAPCSASGTLRRNPDLKLRLSPEDIERLPNVQLEILQTYQSFVRVGGRLIYVTCSIFEKENQSVVDKFLQFNTNFSPLSVEQVVAEIQLPVDISRLKRLVQNKMYLQLLPHVHDTDGFFIAVLERIR